MFQSIAAKLAVYKNKLHKKKNEQDNVSLDQNMQSESDIDVSEKETPLGGEDYESLVNENNLENADVENVVDDQSPVEEQNLAAEDNLPPKKRNLVKVLIISVLLFLAVCLGAAYYYISNIDWNQHKDKIADQFSEITGKRIVFDGPIQLTLFPSPSLQAADIKIYNPGENLDEPLAKVKSLVANLTLKSLLNGDFDVKMMSLVEPDIRLELLENNQLNWDSTLSNAQRANLENMEITLDSVLVKNATIHWVDDVRKKNYTIGNINAEVIAQSIFGPYRIEGTYIKNNQPEGFAFSIGKITSGLSTSINAVINQPSTETFVRFDGSILPQNNAVNGNLIFESKKLMNFVNSNLDKIKLKPEYDYPLAVTLELKSNKQKVELTNFAVKYGNSAGAGNLLVPMAEGEFDTAKKNAPFRPKVEFSFNFASLDLEPLSKLVLEFWQQYGKGQDNYNPQLDFDLLADIKAVKSVFNEQTVKDLKLSFDVLNNKVIVRDLSAVLPGDTSFILKGDVYSDLGYLTFNLQPVLKTDEFRQTLNWLGLKPNVSKDTLLRRVNLSATVAGNFNKISISPLNLNLDNSVIKGEIGIIRDKRFNIYTNLKTNMFNIDDYFSDFSINNNKLSWAQNLDERFQKLEIFNDLYAELRLNADTIIYNGLPYGGVVLNGSLQQGILQLNSFNIENFAGAKLDLKGKIKGFGKKAEVENLKFNLETKKLNELFVQMNWLSSNLDLKKFNNFSAKGILTGFADHFATKSIIQLENIGIDFGGSAEYQNGAYVWDGNLEVKSPDFVKMLNDFNFKYEPKTYVLGLFNLKTKFVGNLKKFNASDMLFNIGTNTFQGEIGYDATLPKSDIIASLIINRFELDKFFYNSPKVKITEKKNFDAKKNVRVDFLERPDFNVEKFNFDFLSSFNFSGKFDISRLIYKDLNFDFCRADFSSKDNEIKLENFEANFNSGRIKSDFNLVIKSENPSIRGNVRLENVEISEQDFSGAKFGLKSGILNMSMDYDSIADSFAGIFNNLKAEGSFSIANAVLKGWNIKTIHDDLQNRKSAQGLSSFVKNKLTSGSELFKSVQGNFIIKDAQINISDSQWQGDGFTALFNAHASLLNWEGEEEFVISFSQPSYLPNFSVLYSGSLSVPTLNVNVDDLSTMYYQRQQEILAKEAAAQAAEKEKLRQEFDDVLLKTKSLQSEIENVVRPDLNLKKKQVQDPEVITIYENIDQRLRKIESDIATVLLEAQKPDVTPKMIKDAEASNKLNSNYLRNLKENIKNVYESNLKYSIKLKYDYISEQNKQAKNYLIKYKTDKTALDKRLSMILTPYSLDKDETFLRLKNVFQGQILALNKIAEKVHADYADMSGKNEFDLDTAYREISALEADVQKYIPNIEDAFKQIFVYADERVKIAEETYQKQKREEEIKKKLEENTGSISVKGTGISKTVVRELEDIEKAEEAVDSKETKVLDFGQKKSNVRAKSSVIKTKSDDESNSGGIVKKNDGKIYKATGVIIRK